MLFCYNIKYRCGKCGHEWIGSKYANRCPECEARTFIKLDLLEDGILFSSNEGQQAGGQAEEGFGWRD